MDLTRDLTMVSEDTNSSRKYSSESRPRRFAASALLPATPVNVATHSLFNNSQTQWLVLRNLHIINSSTLIAAMFQGTLGTHNGRETPIMPTEAALPGQHFYVDQALFANPTFVFSPGAVSAWTHEFPIAIIPPQWRFQIADQTVAEQCTLGFFWEAVFAEEIDFMWW